MSASAGGPQRARRLVLCGPMGAETTETGRALAAALGLAFHDTDEGIEAATGRRVADLVIDEGAPAFRELERTEAVRALDEETGVVVLGSAAVLDSHVQDRLAGRDVVFLDVGVADAARRLGLDRPRPHLGLSPRAAWTVMYSERRPAYERVSTLRVDTSGKSPDEVADEVVALLMAGSM